MRLTSGFLLVAATVALADSSGRSLTPAGLVAGWEFSRWRRDREEKSGKPLDLKGGKIERDGLALDHGYAMLRDPSVGLVTGSMSVEAWVKLDDLPRVWTCLVCRGTPGENSQSYGLYVGNRGCTYFTTTAQNLQSPNGKVEAGVWTHLVGVVEEKGDLRVYVNGECVSRVAATEGVRDRGGAFCIGGGEGQYSHGLSGAFRSVRVFNYAMPEPDVLRRSKRKP
jgi:hypothetical protein